MKALHPVANALATLQEVLQRDQARGCQYIRINRDSAATLRNIPQWLHTSLTPPAVSAPTAPLPPPASEPPQRLPVEAALPSSPPDVGASAGAGPLRVPLSAGSPTEPRSAASLPSVPAMPATPLDEAAVRQQLNGIFRDVKTCQELQELGSLFSTIVFATGNPMADIVFVGEAPGAEEEKLKKPFVGPAGQKLDQIIGAMGIKREEVYITNIVKFRPKKGDGRFQGASNRKPDAMEMAASIPFVRREIAAVRPKVIVALGVTAAEGLLEIGGTVSALRGRVHTFEGVPLVVTYHPSFLLRQESENPEARRVKRSVWEDMLRVMELAALPISDKQLNYFT